MKITEEQKQEQAREKFFNFLLKKPCTFRQAEEYLSHCEIPEELKKLLLTEAKSMSLVDDLVYAKLFVDGHLTWGNAKIIYELSAKGISREKINEALDEAEDEASRAREVSKGWQNLGLDKRKIINRLLSRGFSHKAASSVFEK
ncbi:MAG: RecX family transcriptional regulator [Synergistaceae bacterium]|nr:RecX family transcriptional regulator [Synergistaceae bacterium]